MELWWATWSWFFQPRWLGLSKAKTRNLLFHFNRLQSNRFKKIAGQYFSFYWLSELSLYERKSRRLSPFFRIEGRHCFLKNNFFLFMLSQPNIVAFIRDMT